MQRKRGDVVAPPPPPRPPPVSGLSRTQPAATLPAGPFSFPNLRGPDIRKSPRTAPRGQVPFEQWETFQNLPGPTTQVSLFSVNRDVCFSIRLPVLTSSFGSRACLSGPQQSESGICFKAIALESLYSPGTRASFLVPEMTTGYRLTEICFHLMSLFTPSAGDTGRGQWQAASGTPWAGDTHRVIKSFLGFPRRAPSRAGEDQLTAWEGHTCLRLPHPGPPLPSPSSELTSFPTPEPFFKMFLLI